MPNQTPRQAAPQQRQQSQPRPSKQRTGQLSGVQIMFAAILAIGMILAINFSTRITASRPLREFYDIVQTEIGELQQEQATLAAELSYAQSDAYVEQWARKDGKMVRSGEVLVIPLSVYVPTEQAPQSQEFVEIDTSPPKPETWELWWALFFDGPPP